MNKPKKYCTITRFFRIKDQSDINEYGINGWFAINEIGKDNIVRITFVVPANNYYIPDNLWFNNFKSLCNYVMNLGDCYE